MPFSVKIPILNNTDCTTALIVEYKKSTQSESEWVRLPPQPSADFIMVNDLDDCTTYNIRAIKQCCNGQFSTGETIDITTGGDCG